MPTQQFGGSHTEAKLDIVEKYLKAYATVMKKQNFRLVYVDGFAGSGSSISKSDAKGQENLALFDLDTVVQGSAVRALGIEPPFDEFLFVEKRAENVRSLRALIATEWPTRNAAVEPGDANVELVKFCQRIQTEPMTRAVVFLDPFGLSVKWGTIAALAATRKVDLWYLVPAHGMSRQIKANGDLLPGSRRIDEALGTTNWLQNFVRDGGDQSQAMHTDLLGHPIAQKEKVGGASEFSGIMRTLLATEFKGGVSSVAKPLGRNGRHEFSLVFACANPSRPAHEAALRIANHILKA